jgi:hypothetical protein
MPKATFRVRQPPVRAFGSLTPVSSTEPVLGCVFLIPYSVFSTKKSTVTRHERWPLTGCRALRVTARELTSRAVVAAVGHVVAGWVRLTVFDPKVSFVVVHYGEKLTRAPTTRIASSDFGPLLARGDGHARGI